MNRREIEALLPEGYRLKSPETANQATPIHLICPKGHDWPKARLGNIKNNNARCPVCRNLRMSQEQKYDQNIASEKLLQLGWKLVSKYTGSHSKVHIRCIHCGHKRHCLYYNIKNSCRKCWKNRSRDQCMVKLENELKRRNASLLWIEDPTKVSTSKIIYLCENNHQVHTTYNKLTDKDQECRKCAGLAKLDIETIKSKLRAGYEYVSGSYENIHSELVFKCPKGHHYKTSWNKHQTGYGCNHRDCCNTSPLRSTDIHNRAKELDIKWIDGDYVNVDSQLKWTCLRNKKHPPFTKSMRQLHHSKTWPCPLCAKGYTRSKGEIEVANFIKSLGVDIITNDRNVLGVDIDILVPDKKFGVEFCGLFYHSEKFRDVRHHYDKYKVAKAHGYRIFFLYEDEWKNRCERVKDYIQMKLLDNFEVVKADECDVVDLRSNEYNPFIDQNHIQGRSNPGKKIALGLNHPKHGLVYVLTAQKNHWNSTSNLYEVDRFVSKSNLRVSGGATKLFSVLLKELKAIGVSEVRTYSDRRYSWGNLYKQMGFRKSDKEMAISDDYQWVRGMERRSKQSMRLKSHEKETSSSVDDLRRQQGWSKIYGCGKDTWIYKIESDDLNKKEFCKLHGVQIIEKENVTLVWRENHIIQPTFDKAFRIMKLLIDQGL